MDAYDFDCQVIDLCATNGQRAHELMGEGGRPIRFIFKDQYEPTAVPYKYAKQLIGNEGFEVRDKSGSILRPMPKKAKDENPLSIDEVVAKFDELHRDALVARAARAGKKFTTTSKKQDIVEYLIGQNIGAVSTAGHLVGPKTDVPLDSDGDAGEAVVLEEEDAY